MPLRILKRKKKQSAFDHWWNNSRSGLGPLKIEQMSLYEAAKAGFDAGRKSVPTSKKLRDALRKVLTLLDDFDAGFDGFGEMRNAEKLLGQSKSRPR